MQLIFVHGWSVTNTDTYGQLPEALVAACAEVGLDLTIRHIQLGKYVSFHDEVTLDDITRGLNQALHDLPGNADQIQPFSCITHSTGGPVVRHWIDRFYGPKKLAELPLRHLVMLAPANHGSALAVLGKKRVGRFDAWFKGLEPGQKVLDWLSLGSLGQRTLNAHGLDYDYAANNVYPFVLTGQGIDRKFYDFINNYLVEPGSDGVVRVAGANMNYRFFSLKQTAALVRRRPATTGLVYDAGNPLRSSPAVPLGVYHDYSHSGGKMGIMKSIIAAKGDSQPVVADIVKCLQVESAADYSLRGEQLAALTKAEQDYHRDKHDVERYAMLIFHVHDDQGNHFSSDDYDILLLAGKTYQPHAMPKGFFQDRQMNTKTSNLVYYVDIDRMHDIKDGLFGIRVVARPTRGFSYYCLAEFRSDGVKVDDVLVANQTTYVDICLTRCVDKNVFRFARGDEKRGSFKGVKADGGGVE
ncbi:MAG: phospholipase [Desulfuromonas sp.]|nr:phospholipase [Desulfuromonas sp.]